MTVRIADANRLQHDFAHLMRDAMTHMYDPATLHNKPIPWISVRRRLVGATNEELLWFALIPRRGSHGTRYWRSLSIGAARSSSSRSA